MIAELRRISLSHFSVDGRMQWAVKRNKKGKAEWIYCLLGEFDTFILPTHGEGENSFVYLQEVTHNTSKSEESPVTAAVVLSVLLTAL